MKVNTKEDGMATLHQDEPFFIREEVEAGLTTWPSVQSKEEIERQVFVVGRCASQERSDSSCAAAWSFA